MGIARYRALLARRGKRTIVEEVLGRLGANGLGEVQVHRVSPVPGPRILLAGHQDVSVRAVATRRSPIRLRECTPAMLPICSRLAT